MASAPAADSWEESGPGYDAAVTELLVGADSLYAVAAWYACGHCDTVGHGPCSSRRGVGLLPLARDTALGLDHCP